MTTQWNDPAETTSTPAPALAAAPPSPPGGIDYPVRYWVDFPEGPRNRLTVFFRSLMVMPIFALLVMLTSSNQSWVGLAPLLALMLMILVRGKYPRPWFNWWVYLVQLSARVMAYFVSLRDEYPSTDEEQAVHLEMDYPQDDTLNRVLPFVKWLLAIPHYFLILLLGVASLGAALAMWLGILFTGRTPRRFFDLVVAVNAWGLRVQGYAFTLVTDRYPPFSLGFGVSGGTVALSALIGIVFYVVMIALFLGFVVGMMDPAMFEPGRGLATPMRGGGFR